MFSGSRILPIFIKSVCITCVLSLEIKTGQIGVRLKRQTTNTAPSFAQEEYRASIPENQASGLSVILITATDPDQGENGKLTYSMAAIRDTRSNKMFTINPISGQVNTTMQLDREAIPRHDFTVTATDNNVLFKKSAVAMLIITVEDENDHTPTFDQNIYKVSKEENIPAATTISTVRAIDRDSGKNSEIRYSIIVPPNPSTFKINPISGSISTLKVLDREVRASYQLIVQAKDQANLGKQRSSTATVEIKVLDENDNYPQFDQSSYIVNVSEESAIPSQIVRVLATDKDAGRNQEIVYSIADGNVDDIFSINSTSGEVTLKTHLDYEKSNLLNLRIEASDNGQYPKTNITTLKINIVDINDNASVFQQDSYTAMVQEGVIIGATVLTVQAIDVDSGQNSQLEYSIPNAPSGFPFAIDTNQGRVFVSAALDRERRNYYSFIVEVTDRGLPPLTSSATVVIMIQDINDNAPVFQQYNYTAMVQESVIIGSTVLTVQATDADSGKNSLLEYSIPNSPFGFPFAIDTNNGRIFVSSSLDREKQDSYLFIVEARDHGIPPFTSTTTVEIKILDINDNSPVFSLKHMFVDLSNDAPLGQYVTRLTATDNDLGNNADITYNITSGNSEQTFGIGSKTGVITLERLLKFTKKSSFILTVTASDGIHFDTSEVYVNVTYSKYHTLSFLNESYHFNVYEEENIDTSIGNVQATYTGAVQNGGITYELLKTHEFSINPRTGEIRTLVLLDRELQLAYWFEVLAVANADRTRQATARVSVSVKDLNDNTPSFSKLVYEASIRKPVSAGRIVTTVRAVDADIGINSQIRYSLYAAKSILDNFKIDSMNGVIYIAQSNTIDKDSTSIYTMTVLAVDSGVVPLTAQSLVRIKVEADVVPVG